MSFTDAVSRVSQIQAQIASLQGAFDPSAAAAPSQGVAGAGAAATGTSSSFASALAQAQQPGAVSGAQDVSAAGGASLPGSAQGLLTSSQQQFASRLAAQTGLDPSVIS